MDSIKGWTMIALTLIFILLYGSSLVGWLKPLPDEKMLGRLEPIIFISIGYYFGRLPSQQNEKTLKDEIRREAQKANAAQQAREQSQQAREALEEKIKNIKAVLTSTARTAPKRSLAENPHEARSPMTEETLRHSVQTALDILNS